LKASQNTMLELKAEIAKHSHPTNVGSPTLEKVSETIVDNPLAVDLIDIRQGASPDAE
jgi:hypothetical protein